MNPLFPAKLPRSQRAIGGSITITKIEFYPEVLGEYLANDSRATLRLASVAQSVKAEAQRNLMQLGPPGRGKVDYPLFKGRRWSAQPAALAKMIRVDGPDKFRNLNDPIVRKARVLQTFIVKADHPYSRAYQYGGFGIRPSAFFSKAINAVRAKHPDVRRERGFRAPRTTP